MLTTMAQVAVGAAIGGAARFGVGVFMLRIVGATVFPLAIITVNVIGSFLMGLFVVWAAQRGMTGWNPFVMTGILGGFTTFSAFSLEVVTLIERGQVNLAAIYIAASIGLSIGALFAGVLIARGMGA